jgi:HD-like signal output (HDOD) protein
MPEKGGFPKLSELLDKPIRLPALPRNAGDILRMTARPTEEIDPGELVDVIASDPGLTVQLLRLANSPFFGVSRQITSPRRAVDLIGIRHTVEMLSFSILEKTITSDLSSAGYSVEDHWRHSLACASIARLLGNPSLLIAALPGELYLAGLMHDIGKVLLAYHLSEELARCTEMAAEEQIPLDEAERRTLGTDHAEVGASLLDDWDIPVSVQGAVAFHHRPGAAPREHREAAAALEFANMLAHGILEPEESGDLQEAIAGTHLIREMENPLRDPSRRTPFLADVLEQLQRIDKMTETPSEETADKERKPEAPPESGSANPESGPKGLRGIFRGAIGKSLRRMS